MKWFPPAADGKPDLTAPTPRTSEGKPDFSGVWMVASGADTGNQPLQPWAANLQRKRAAERIEFMCHGNQMFLKLTGRAPR